jgi:2-keto-4-pentenoate hydratase/2-oxohepta-3-ene-1,7-dioic acid hydratase in catechol pathway
MNRPKPDDMETVWRRYEDHVEEQGKDAVPPKAPMLFTGASAIGLRVAASAAM